MNKLLIAYLLLWSCCGISQTVCGENQQGINTKFYVTPGSYTLPPNTYDEDTQHVFNVTFHVVYNDDGVTRTNSLGQPGISIGFDEIMEAIRNLNVNFNQFNIFFKYRGFDQINESDYLIIENSTELTALNNSTYADPTSLNVFIINGGVIGAAARPLVFDDNFFVKEWTIVHEFGHKFGLLHPNVSNPGCLNTEHSPRVPGTGFNADVKGDRVVDTHVPVPLSFFDANWNYTGGAVDCQGVPIVPVTLNGFLIKPDYSNFMYAEDDEVTLDPYFSPGQGKKMRENIIGYWAAEYNAVRNTVISLYQPYAVTTHAGTTIVSTTNNGDGTATICRNTIVEKRFQKGFDYVFPNNIAPDPINVGIDLLPIVHQSCSFPTIINQLDPVTSQVSGPCVRVRPTCTIEPITGGRIASTRNMGSMNLTEKLLSKSEINDPNLYDNLQAGYYHIIKRVTSSGAIVEEVMYKR